MISWKSNEKVDRRYNAFYIDILWIIRYFLQAPFTSWQPISSSCWYSSKLLVIAYLEVLAILLIAELSTSSSTPSQNHIASLNNCCLGIHKRRLKLVLLKPPPPLQSFSFSQEKRQNILLPFEIKESYAHFQLGEGAVSLKNVLIWCYYFWSQIWFHYPKWRMVHSWRPKNYNKSIRYFNLIYAAGWQHDEIELKYFFS